MTSNRTDPIPLPLAMHLATHTVIGLFCMIAGFLNMIDPWVKGLQGIGFFTLMGFSWGYVYGIVTARKEAVMLGLAASAAYGVAGLWRVARGRVVGAPPFALRGFGFLPPPAHPQH